MIEAYEDEGKFGKNENDTFLAVYNAHKDEFDNTTKEVAELNYKIGMMYFNYYTEEDGSYSFQHVCKRRMNFFVKTIQMLPDLNNRKRRIAIIRYVVFIKIYLK